MILLFREFQLIFKLVNLHFGAIRIRIVWRFNQSTKGKGDPKGDRLVFTSRQVFTLFYLYFNWDYFQEASQKRQLLSNFIHKEEYLNCAADQIVARKLKDS